MFWKWWQQETLMVILIEHFSEDKSKIYISTELVESGE